MSGVGNSALKKGSGSKGIATEIGERGESWVLTGEMLV